MFTSSLVKMCLVCVRSVFTETKSSAAMSAFEVTRKKPTNRRARRATAAAQTRGVAEGDPAWIPADAEPYILLRGIRVLKK